MISTSPKLPYQEVREISLQGKVTEDESQKRGCPASFYNIDFIFAAVLSSFLILCHEFCDTFFFVLSVWRLVMFAWRCSRPDQLSHQFLALPTVRKWCLNSTAGDLRLEVFLNEEQLIPTAAISHDSNMLNSTSRCSDEMLISLTPNCVLKDFKRSWIS